MPSVKILNSNGEWEYAASGGGGGGEVQVNLDMHIAADNPHQLDADKVGADPAGTAQTKADAALDSAKDYTNEKVAGLASTKYVDDEIGNHNTAPESHNDIRVLITDLNTKLTHFLDVDETTTDELSEVLALIDANRGTLDSLTTSKVNVSDIIDNLTTNRSSKVLSAAQGVAIKALIDTLQEELDSHTHTVSDITDLTATVTELNYVDGVKSNIQTQLDGKQPTITGAASSVVSSDLDADRVLISGPTGKIGDSGVTTKELGTLSGVTSSIQAQLDEKAPAGFGLGTVASPISNTDLVDTLKLAQSGWYRGTNVTNAPVTGWCFFEIIADSSAYSAIKAYPASGGEYTSAYVNSVLKPWTFNATTDTALMRDGSNAMTNDLKVSKEVASVEALFGAITNYALMRAVNKADGKQSELLLHYDIESGKWLLTVRDQNNQTHNVYHTGWKPTAEDVGAVSKAGDNTLTGRNTVETTYPAMNFKTTKNNSYAQVGQTSSGISYLYNYGADGKYNAIYINPATSENGLSFVHNATGNSADITYYDIYHEGNKPTAADVGAMPYKRGTATLKANSTGWYRLFTFSGQATNNTALVMLGNTYYSSQLYPQGVSAIVNLNTYQPSIVILSGAEKKVFSKLRIVNIGTSSMALEAYYSATNQNTVYATAIGIGSTATFTATVDNFVASTAADADVEVEQTINTIASGNVLTQMPTAADVGAAPAGFGLGTNVVKAPTTDVSGDANAIKGTGFYTAITNTAFDSYGWSYIIHIQSGTNDWTQVCWHPSRDLGVKVRECKSGTIGEWKTFLSVAGGGVPKVDITDTTPTSATTYYPLYADAKSGVSSVRANKDLYYYDTGSTSYFNIGSSDQKGGLTLHAANGKYVNVATSTSLTSNRDLTLPDVSGTIYTTAGGTMNGGITMSGEYNFTGKMLRKKSDGGTWAYTPFRIVDQDNKMFANVGVYGTATDLIYTFIGDGGYDSANNLKIYPTGKVTANAVHGAVWNDYAEYREANTTEPGRVVCEYGDDTLRMATERLQPGASVVSDTFGFAIGETETAKTPIAVSGRVLVYTFEDRNTYSPGDAVCAAPNGTVSKMSREEIINYPERIVGTVSAVPSYETWGESNVSVNGRIWIKVK